MAISKNISFTAEKSIHKKIKHYLKHNVGSRRFSHSLEVSKLAKKLCLHYNIDPYKGIVAGLGHDIARELCPADIMYYAEQDSFPVSEMEKHNPLLLHGRAGAIILQTEFGIRDEEVITAVRDHVLGKPNMIILSKIIFAADFLEPKRNILNETYRKNLLRLSLDQMLFQVLTKIFSFLQQQNYPVAEQSLCMYDSLKECLKLNEKN